VESSLRAILQIALQHRNDSATSQRKRKRKRVFLFNHEGIMIPRDFETRDNFLHMSAGTRPEWITATMGTTHRQLTEGSSSIVHEQ
jgi:hypothetical protein